MRAPAAKLPARSRRLAAALLGLAVALAAVPSASGRDARPGYQRSRWWDDLERCDHRLRDARWKRGLQCVDRLRKQVSETSWYEPDLGAVLGNLELQRAIAEANLGRDDDAIWDWHEALSLDRGVAETDLAPYGKAADLLHTHPLRRRGEYPEGYHAPEIVLTKSDYRPPVQKERPPTVGHLNSAALGKHLPPVQLEVLFDAQGVPHQPVLLSDWSHPVTVYWALETLRASPPASPALLDGKPVAALALVELDSGGDLPP